MSNLVVIPAPARSGRTALGCRGDSAKPSRLVGRLGAAEAIATTTPAGFYRYAGTLRELHVAPDQLFAFADAHPDAWQRLIERMIAREHDALTALQTSLAGLPAITPDDCAALTARVDALQRSTGPDHGLAAVLAPSLVPCAAR